MSISASSPDGVGYALFGFGSGKEGLAQLSKGTRVPDVVGVWLVVFEASSQLLGLVDDLFSGSWHRSPEVLGANFHGVDNNRPLVGADNSDLVEVAGTIGSDEHRHSLVEVLDENRVVESVEDGLIAHTVLSRTFNDSWLCHKLPCPNEYCKITCDVSGLIR